MRDLNGEWARSEYSGAHSRTEIDLSDMGLEEIPEFVHLTDDVTSINLSRNYFTEIPQELRNCSNLSSLDISGNRLTDLPDWIKDLKYLAALDISKNRFTSIPLKISELPGLAILNVSGPTISNIPEWVGSLATLVQLDISGVHTGTLPPWIGKLRGLTSLRAARNGITSIPEWLSEKTGIEVLDLSGNKISAIPAWAGDLVSLKSLDVSNNRLEELPSQMASLTMLNDFSCSGNRLYDVPEFIERVTSISSLRLANNRIKRLPSWVGSLEGITVLDLSRNQIKELPESVGNLPNLEKLDISGNHLRSMPESMSKLSTLTRLILSENKFDHVPTWVHALDKLEELAIARMNLGELPSQLGEVKSLKKLSLRGLRLTAVPEFVRRFTALEVLDIAENDLGQLPGWMKDLAGLTELDISSTNIQSLPDWIGSLANLSKLDASANHLTSVPPSMALLTNLSELDLSRNLITRLPDDNIASPYMEDLRIDGNGLEELPHWLGQCTHLKVLSISSNPLGDNLPPNLRNLTNLKSVDFNEVKLTQMPGQLRHWVNLTTCAMANNRIQVLPSWLGELQQLETLMIWRNQIKEISEGVRGLRRLDALYLWGNSISSLPEWLGELECLRRLDLESNPLEEIPEWISGLSQLDTLYLGNLGLERVPEWLAQMPNMSFLDLGGNKLSALPEWIGQLTSITHLAAAGNEIGEIPETLYELNQLAHLDLQSNNIIELSSGIGRLRNLEDLNLSSNKITRLPAEIAHLTQLKRLTLNSNEIGELPDGLSNIDRLTSIDVQANRLTQLPSDLALLPPGQLFVSNNPLPPEIKAANAEGAEELHRYLNLLRSEGVPISEAKLVLVGEGGAGKSSLLAAMRGEEFVESRITTHGIEVKEVKATAPSGTIVTLNGWDFGGQPDYRPTHQLFFTAPAIYVVVWSPRRGPEVSYVDYWIEQIRLRAGDEVAIHVVATHADTGHRGAFIDQAALRRRFGKMIAGFHHIDSQTGSGISDLCVAIADTAVRIPHTSRNYPASWMSLRQSVRNSGTTYLPYNEYCRLAEGEGLTEANARSLALSCNELGHWIYYADDPQLADVVTFKPDWLSTAVSFVLDDPVTRENHGLLTHRRVNKIWSDPEREQQYPSSLHPVFLYLMERFDISYRITDIAPTAEPTSLVTQLVSSMQPNIVDDWEGFGEDWAEKTQICEIVDRHDSQTMPTGLMYRLIVRLHRYSLGREDHRKSKHWQTGLLIEDSLYGRALIIEQHNRLTVSVRSVFPPLLLDLVTRAVRDLVGDLWPALRVRVLVPCGTDCPKGQPGAGLVDVEALVEAKKEGMAKCPCRVCNKFLLVDPLLTGSDALRAGTDRIGEAVASALRPAFRDWSQVVLNNVVEIIEASALKQERLVGDIQNDIEGLGRNVLEAMGKVEQHYRELLYSLDDDARDGPRLFTVERLERDLLHPGVTHFRIKVTLWCEHSRLPVHVIDGGARGKGVYELVMPNEWVRAAAPWIRALSVVLRTILPVAAGVADFVAPTEQSWQATLGKQLEHAGDAMEVAYDEALRLEGAQAVNARPVGASGPVAMTQPVMRAFREAVSNIDPTYAGLVRVRAEGGYRWIHPRYESIYRQGLPEVPS